MHNKIYTVTIFIIFFTASVFTNVLAANDELTLLLDNIHTMQASFKQFTVNRSGKQVGQKSLGNMMLERPGKFRWEITQPNKQLLIIKGNQVLIYDIDLAQVTKRKINYNNSGNPAMLLNSSTEELKQMFKITKLPSAGDGLWFELKPKKKSEQDGNYQLIKMYFSGDKLKTIYMLSDLGQKIEIDFYNVVVNSSIAKNKFEFIIPKNVDVLDES